MDIAAAALRAHRAWRGKIEVVSRVPVTTREDLSLAYTPGVAAPCLAIRDDPHASYTYTRRGNLVLVITDGSAVLGLGDIGPEAGMPVMEGKCALFKLFGGVDAFPLCIRSQDVDDIVRTVRLIAGSFGGVNLEDIAAPRCFEIERRLKAECDIPVFHDDQHGTAVVVLAAVINALKVVDKSLPDVRVVISGAGAAAIAVARLLLHKGARDIVLCDREGAIHKGRAGLNPSKWAIADLTNPRDLSGSLAAVLHGADLFIGLSSPGLLDGAMVRSMAERPVVLPLANPDPEILPDEAMAAGAAVVGTGRSDYKNQINNVLAFPGIFRGALDVCASDINGDMQVAAAEAIAGLAAREGLTADRIVPDVLDPAVGPAVAEAVSMAAATSGVARPHRC